jgi:hypothetical protein
MFIREFMPIVAFEDCFALLAMTLVEKNLKKPHLFNI